MNPLDIRKRFAALADKMANRVLLTDEEYGYLENVLRRIAAGEDANNVLGVSYRRGKSENDAIGRQKLSAVLHWVACAIDTDTGLGYTLEEALKFAHETFRYPHELDYLRKKWHEHKAMQSTDRYWSDPDSPFQP